MTVTMQTTTTRPLTVTADRARTARDLEALRLAGQPEEDWLASVATALDDRRLTPDQAKALLRAAGW
jgi:hypothetical protein